ncbi:kinase-like domain-containing protein [Elsinoe ampelina]|uniref:1-phosphatidylinositol 4-kinase n=1 Tax=Elsinoe ampelina TaxID=302913 RepID=A0A6A6FZL0_9PEZI|nr:kinase-like domain-containing protein [Elsinoe ampelina]
MSWNLLERFLESEHFNKDPSLTVAYLARYADHVGIQYVLCSKLRKFPHEEIEFFLPQLCHLLISIDNESMALEEFIIDLCEDSVNAALLTFWLFQTYLRDLSTNPNSSGFKKCRRIYNRVQRIVFGASEPVVRGRIKDNILPTTVLASLVLTSVAAPFFPAHGGPLAIAQARKPRQLEQMVSEPVQIKRPARSHTVSGDPARPRRPRAVPRDGEGAPRPRRPAHKPNLSVDVASSQGSPSAADGPAPKRHALLDTKNHQGYISSSSLPDPKLPQSSPMQSPDPNKTTRETRRPVDMQRRHSHAAKALTPTSLSPRQKTRILRSNYFKLETQFLTALEDISNRLVVVPKPARLSALRAELALIAQDLPAEVDIPILCPATLEDGKPGRSKHHRIVRLNPAEATSLNSAERVPYLLMVEVLREDFDFDPDSHQNSELIARLLADKNKSKRRLFDITDGNRATIKSPEEDGQHDSVFEPAMGDLASPALLQDPDGDEKQLGQSTRTPPPGAGQPLKEPPRLSSGVSTVSTSSLITPRNSEQPISRSSSPGARLSNSNISRTGGSDQTDFNALATHMRTASQMLAQLELSSSKRPKAEVAAIKAKIIASMQTLEEQSFYTDEVITATPASLAAMIDSANAAGATASPDDISDDASTTSVDPNLSTNAGAARMENDIKTGGVSRPGDRDDPSAATFGEAWSAKRERIRRSSPYGWMKNWDLVSVIVKTGADLRQEAFACQLIDICGKIWHEASVDVWVKPLRILVTGESSGLIETITNGVSLHSLKRSLTLSSIASGKNPRKRIATLKDHFLQAFGPESSPAHSSAVTNFALSLAGYSVISYVLQLKDRHNGNILLSDRGHIIHIDFGFMLSNSPGSMGFEAAPFKLTAEYVDVLGGLEGEAYALFVRKMKDAFQALRREAERVVMLVELMGRESRMPCYAGGVGAVVAALRGRFVLEKSEREAEAWVEELVGKSAGSYYTRLYDTFQYRTQGIY